MSPRSRLVRMLEEEYDRVLTAGAPDISPEEAHLTAFENVKRLGYQILDELERAGFSPFEEPRLDA